MEEDFRALLLAATAVTDICGTRINFGAHPQGQALPAIVLNTVDNQNGHDLQGSDGLFQGRVQVDCYADTYGGAKLLSRAALATLDGHSDTNFSGVFIAGSRDGREGGTNEADRPFRVSLDFLTNWRS